MDPAQRSKNWPLRISEAETAILFITRMLYGYISLMKDLNVRNEVYFPSWKKKEEHNYIPQYHVTHLSSHKTLRAVPVTHILDRCDISMNRFHVLNLFIAISNVALPVFYNNPALSRPSITSQLTSRIYHSEILPMVGQDIYIYNIYICVYILL